MSARTLKIQNHFATAFQYTAAAFRGLSPAWRDSLLTFFAGRLLYTLIGVFIWQLKIHPDYVDAYYYEIRPMLDGSAGMFLGVWQRWDGIHYLRIADFGYINDQVSLFYPLYPMLGRWLAAFTHWNTTLSLLVISSAAFLLSMVMLHKLISGVFSEQTARTTLVTMVLFPSGFYFYAIFPQSLLLFLVLLTYWFARKGWWAGALAAGFLAGLTHSTAVALAILVGIEALQYLWTKANEIRAKRFVFEWKIVLAVLAPFGSLLGLASFMLWRSTAGFSPYIALQSSAYSRALTMPWEGLISIIQFVLSPPNAVNYVVAWMNTAMFFLMVVLSVWSFRRIPWSWWFMQTGFLVFITTNLTVGYPLIGFFRYSLVIFPLFVEIALIGQTPRWRLGKFALGLILSFIYSAMFFLWHYDF